jgi:beta-lactamase class D
VKDLEQIKTNGEIMVKYILLTLTLFSAPVYSQQKQFEGVDGCFILYDMKANKELIKYGDKRCAERVAACSTFKVPLALMAFDKGILKDEDHLIKWDGVQRFMPSWNKDQTAASWMRDSVVWYSQALTAKLGQATMEKYLTDYGYGTHDMSGGLSDAWLTVTPSDNVSPRTTLKISADEQVQFMIKLFNNELRASKHALATTKKIMFIEKSTNGFELSGKTGSGYLSVTPDIVRIGWFVSHLQRGNQELVAVTAFTDKRKNPPYKFGGLQAREITKSILVEKGYWSKP